MDPTPNTVADGIVVPLSRPTTPAGLPYPTSQDLLADVDVYLHELSDAIDYRLTNRALLMSQPSLTSNAGGDLTINFPTFVTLQGLVIEPFANSSDGAAMPWVLLPRITGLPGNSATVHVDYMNTKNNGYNVSPFGGTMQYSIFAWGVPQ
jgi:hypothetical protein